VEISNFLKQKISSQNWKTPFYYYDFNIVEKNFRDLENSLSNRFKIFYSMKSNPHHGILTKLKSLGCLLDISSIGELDRALAAGFTGKEISFVGPGKSQEELIACVTNNIEYTVIESIQELESFAAIAKNYDKIKKVCLRINPATYYHPGGAARNMSPVHFGIDETEVLNAKVIFDKNKHIVLAGLHFYLQSQFLDAAVIVANFKSFISCAVKLEAGFNTKFEMINFGGGFGIPYFQGQNKLDLSLLKDEIQALLKSEESSSLKDTLFFVESGRFLSGPAGFFVTKVLYTKKSYGKNYAVCDGGITQHQAAVGIGQILRRNFPIRAVKMKEDSKTNEVVTIVGPSCYSIDILGSDVELPQLMPGDAVVIEQSGAYGPTFSPENFLSRPKANEYTNESE